MIAHDRGPTGNAIMIEIIRIRSWVIANWSRVT